MIAAVVLAAGASTRLGRPKQLVRVGGRSLLGHAVACAEEGGCRPVLVVVGAHAPVVTAELGGQAVQIVPCHAWREGLAASIRAGIQVLETGAPDVRGALLLVCDQPRLTPEVVRGLIRAFDGRTGRIVACEYAGGPGVPAVFERSRFAELQQLPGPGGAKSLLVRHRASLLRVPWAEGALDVDLPDDARDLERSGGSP